MSFTEDEILRHVRESERSSYNYGPPNLEEANQALQILQQEMRDIHLDEQKLEEQVLIHRFD
jgi:hypothetical protein